MAEKRFIIEVRSKGFAKATRDFDKLDKSTKSYNRTADRMRGSTSGLIANIGSLRNKILVYSFALGGATAAVNKFIGASVQFENARVRLEGLTGSAELASQAFDNFRGVASRTPFQLADVVNAGITLESFGVNANDTLESLVDLAAFMQTTATEAASALGRAYAGGAGAADILRERGILQIIKDSRGIQDLSKITLPEFRQALIAAMADPDGRISGSADRLSETFSGAVSNMQDSINEFAATIGDLVLDDMKALVNSIEDFFRAIDIKRIKEFTTALFSLGIAIGLLKLKNLVQSIKALDAFSKAMLRFNIATQVSVALTGRFVKVLGLMAALLVTDFFVQQLSLFDDFSDKVDNATDSTQKFNKEIDDYNFKTVNIVKTTESFSKSVDDVEKALSNQRNSLKLQIAELEGKSTRDLALIETGGQLTGAISDTSREIDILNEKLKDLKGSEEFKQATEASINSLKSERDAIRAKIAELNGTDLVGQRLITTNKLLTTEEENLIKEIEDLTQKLQNQKDAQEALNNAKNKSLEKDRTFLSLLGQTTEGQKANIQSTIDMVKANRQQFEVLGDVDSVLTLLGEQMKDLEENDPLKGMAESSQGIANGILAASRAMITLRDSSEITHAQILQTIGSMLMMIPGAQVHGAVLQAAGMFIGHTGGLIKNNGIQRFANGGMVQGQDNVPILAQEGEFIMRREAVQNIGVQNLADMNRSGQGGGVTLNIQGNMIANDEFVRDTLIPQIAKASRQGLA